MALAMRCPAVEAASVNGACGHSELDLAPDNRLHDDLLQEGLLRVLEACRRHPGRTLPAAFSAAVARNVLREHRREQRRRAEVPLSDGPDGGAAAPAISLDAADLHAAVAEILAGFTEAQQVAFSLLRVERLPAREAARLIGCTEKALRRRAETAVTKLRRALGVCAACRLDGPPGGRPCPAESEKIRCLKYLILQHLQNSSGE